jgi:hypothetical protein
MASVSQPDATNRALRSWTMIGGPVLAIAAIAYILLSPQLVKGNVLVATGAALTLGIVCAIFGYAAQFLEAREQATAFASLEAAKQELAAANEEADRVVAAFENDDGSMFIPGRENAARMRYISPDHEER